MSQAKTILVTGANRGIGLGLTTRLLSKGHTVLAAARNPSGARELWELEHSYPGRCKILELDVTSDVDLHRLAGELQGTTLDILINNAGAMVKADSSSQDLAEADVLKSFTINTIGPMRVTRSLLPHLQRAAAPVMVAVSSQLGSIADNTSGSYYAYRMSKAALNMYVKTFAIEHRKITSVVVHPGWVQTDMGGASAPTSIEESTTGLVNVILGLKPADSGRFLDFRGKELSW